VEIEKMLVLSTSHLTEQTCNGWFEKHKEDFPCYEKIGAGWFVHVVVDGVTEYPDDLQKCISLAIEIKCDWIMFDRDGPVLEYLLSYDW
jgi:hypothetical protein